MAGMGSNNISNPAIIVGFPKFIDYFSCRADLYQNYDKFEVIPYAQNAYYDYFKMLRDNQFGIPLLILSFFRFIYSFIKGEKAG